MQLESPRSERPVLSRELSEFLVELSVSLHRFSMYPTGHPSLGPAVAAITRRAEKLLQDRPSIAFGVARRQLIIEGVTTDPNQPVLRRLSEGLHRHHIGAVSIARGVEPQEFDEALKALAAETEREGPLGLTRGAQFPRWPHLRLHPLTFDGLTLVGEAPMAAGPQADNRQASREVELWIGLARAALSAEEASTPIEQVPTEPTAVAKAIDEHPRAEAYDQVIVGYLVQIAQELKGVTGTKAAELRRRTSRLIASLRPETLRRLVEMGGDTTQRSQFVSDATHGMAVDAVMEIVKAAAEASGQSISHGLFRMLSKLAMHAEAGNEFARPRADEALREQVERLLEGWSLEDPNPEGYGRVLQHLATSATPETAGGPSPATGGSDPVRLLQISLEAGAFGPLVKVALDEAVKKGLLRAVLDLLASRPKSPTDITQTVMTWLSRPESLTVLLRREPLDVVCLDALMPTMSSDGYQCVVDALVSSENRRTRRRLLDRLTRTSIDIAPLVQKHLADDRWFVQRNMLVLLERSRNVPEGFSAIPWSAHPDPRVRCEAIRLQLRLPGERELGIAYALEDPDQRVLHLGLTAVQTGCPPDLVPRVIQIAMNSDNSDEIRALAVSGAGKIAHATCLQMLLHLTDGGWSLLGRFRLPPKTPVLLAALRALSETWPLDSRAEAVLDTASDSPDPEVREAVAPIP